MANDTYTANVAVAPSTGALLHPIRVDAPWPHGRDESLRKALAEIEFGLEHGDERTKALAEAFARSLICNVVVAGMLDNRRGLLPESIKQIRKSAQSLRMMLQ